MRCYACDCVLTSREATRKFASGVFTDLCSGCLLTIEDDVELDQTPYAGDDEVELDEE